MIAGQANRSFDSAFSVARSPACGFDRPSPHHPAFGPVSSQVYSAPFDQLDWNDFVPLSRAEIRLQPRWKLAVSRAAHRRGGRRHLAAAIVLATATLTAACASAIRSAPDEIRAPALVSNNSNGQGKSLSDPLPDWAATRAARPSESASVTGIRTATLGRAPFAGASNVIEAIPEAPKASRESEQSQVWSPAAPEPNATGLDHPLTKLVAFAAAPFPYDGMGPRGTPFLDVVQDGQRGHRNRRGEILWESTTFNDRRVLIHMPANFDPNRPSVMVIFFHGYGATLERDVLARQQVPAQISASGANAVLVAPQFAVDARDPSIGHFWEPGGFRRFLDEASRQLALSYGDPTSQQRFAKMPIVLVAYSGGYVPAAWALKDMGTATRVRGILMLDAAYGELERFANFAISNRSSFLVSAYTRYTQGQNAALERMLAAHGVGHETQLNGTLSRGSAVFLAATDDTSHNDFVTRAWTDDPIKNVLMRLPEFRLQSPQLVATTDRRLLASARE